MYETEILAVFKFAGIKSFPIDLTAIANSVGYQVKTYQETAKTQEELRRMMLVSPDAYLVRKHKTIYLNDAVQSIGRKRFSIAHELGHILLLTDDEDSADSFASNLLAPRPIIFARQLKTYDQIAKTFNISTSASNNSLISSMYVPDDAGFEMIDYFGFRSSCPWPHNIIIPVPSPTSVEKTVHTEKKVIENKPQVQPAIIGETKEKKYEAMRRRSKRERKKIRKELQERKQFISYLMDHSNDYNREHSLF